jgi:O-antigen biosynthesis protein WbqP
MIKRAFDLTLAFFGMPALLVFLPVIAILISADSPGPVLFKQQRVGLGQRQFMLYKFRTMKSGTGDLPSHVAGEQNITAVGKWLRRTKLDELPQLINVLKGEMSFVGPRPCLPTQTELVQARAALGVFKVRPGITGAAQIEGLDMSNPAKLAQKDAQYCMNVSLLLDLWIVWATATGRGAGDAAREKG